MNCGLLQNLFSEEKTISHQIGLAKKAVQDSYNKLGILGKIASNVPFFGFVSQEMAAASKNLESLKKEKGEITNQIMQGLDVLKIQLPRTVKDVAGKILNNGQASSSNSAREAILSRFEAAYDQCNRLIGICNTDEEWRGLKKTREKMVYKLLKSGIIPNKSWVGQRKEFGEVLSKAMMKVDEWLGFGTLLHSILESGQHEMFEFLCNFVPQKEMVRSLRFEKYDVVGSPVNAAIRNGHYTLLEIIAKKYPNFFDDYPFRYVDIALAVESGNTDTLRVLAESMSPKNFAYLMKWEGESYSPLHGVSILGWAIKENDTDLLAIIEPRCPPALLEEYRELYA